MRLTPSDKMRSHWIFIAAGWSAQRPEPESGYEVKASVPTMRMCHVFWIRLARQRRQIAVCISRTPEFGHRHVAFAREFKVVERTVSVGLAVEEESVLMAPLAQAARIVAGELG